MEIYSPLHIHIYISLRESVHNIQPCFCASSLALAFSIFAILAADLEPRTPPPQCRFISSKRSLKLVCRVTRIHLSYCNTRACLAPDKCPKTSLAVYYVLRNSHLVAKCWQEQYQLNWVNIMCNNKQLSFLLFY